MNMILELKGRRQAFFLVSAGNATSGVKMHQISSKNAENAEYGAEMHQIPADKPENASCGADLHRILAKLKSFPPKGTFAAADAYRLDKGRGCPAARTAPDWGYADDRGD